MRLKEDGTGCHIGNEFVGALGYADDLTLNCPTVSGLQHMIHTCEEFGAEYSVKYNDVKTVCIKFDRFNLTVPTCHITINGKQLAWKSYVIHLGNVLTSDMDDSMEMTRKKSCLMSNVNMLLSKFYMANRVTKSRLFSTFCTSMYSCQLWDIHSEAFSDYQICWNKSVRRLLGLPYQTHRSLLPLLIKCEDPKKSVIKRNAKFISNMINTDNSLMNFIARRAVLFHIGYLGKTMQSLKCIYNVDPIGLLSKDTQVINQINKTICADNSDVLKSNIVKEIIDSAIPGFSCDEMQDILYDICVN